MRPAPSVLLAVAIGALVSGRAADAQTCALHAHAPAPAHGPILLDGLGDRQRMVSATPSALVWFNQGLKLVYAFNHAEAIRSFQEGARIDPSCAMCFWGVALALGPNINMPMDSAAEKQASEALANARAVAKPVSEVEKDLISALWARYGGPEGRGARDAAYAEAMRKLAKKYPLDADVQTLFAESMMDLRPWDFWTHEGQPQPGTGEIIDALERAMKIEPSHPGANHYWIHLWEGSPTPERALSSAVLLPKLMPGAGHVVHMPSHLYLRLGRYADASRANEEAIEVDQAYLAKTHADGVYGSMYVAHNFQFLWFTAAMEGRSEASINAANELATRLPAPFLRELSREMPGVDFYVAPKYLALVRFEKWRAILAEPAPPADLTHLAAFWHFARAMALAATGKSDEARREQAAFDAFVDALPPDLALGPINTVASVDLVAKALLAGTLAARRGDHLEAVKQLTLADARERALHYDEPPPWPLPAGEFLGRELLAAGELAKAKTALESELAKYPENGWALAELWRVTQKLEPAQAPAIAERFHRAFHRADSALARQVP